MNHIKHLKQLEKQLEVLGKKEEDIWNLVDREVETIKEVLKNKLGKRVYGVYSPMTHRIELEVEDCPTTDATRDRVNYRSLENMVEEYFEDSHIHIRSHTLLTLQEANIVDKALGILCDGLVGDEKE